VLASLLAIGAVAHLRYAQTLYILPISLFGMSVAAAELPELAREREGAAQALRERMIAAIRRVAFYVVPSFVAFVALGDVLVAGLYQEGEFGPANVTVVWLTLAAYSAGLLASTTTRIYQSGFFALRDTKTPARVATLRVSISAIAGALLMIQFEPVTLGTLTIPGGAFAAFRIGEIPLGPVGLALGASVGAWLEWMLLRSKLSRAMGTMAAGARYYAKTFVAALIAAGVGYLVDIFAKGLYPLVAALVVAGAFGTAYFLAAYTLGLSEARVLAQSVTRRIRRPSA
ncbi:MAG TPA: lipid II flippase MurJ, partial [Steroidobacteraceae bacterium]